jgi:hypothetical protein
MSTSKVNGEVMFHTSLSIHSGVGSLGWAVRVDVHCDDQSPRQFKSGVLMWHHWNRGVVEHVHNILLCIYVGRSEDRTGWHSAAVVVLNCALF